MKPLRQENIIYSAVWGLLFAAPLLSIYVRMATDADIVFSWTEVFIAWRRIALYLLLFLIHNYLLAPLLVYRQKRALYCAVSVVILAAFTFYQCSTGPDIKGHRPPTQNTSPIPHSSFVIHHSPSPSPSPPPPPPIVGEHDIMAVLVLILMFAANIGIKGFFRSRDDRKRLAELERENLEQQLEYLRYQINPHFFMNTLNNIHALVDIDPDKAKDTIIELSKMMRFVLYEGNKQYVPLSREFDFIQHYVALMQLRYTEKVKITLSLPNPSFYSIPPLVLITFIENAFKHGISYQHQSFINIEAEINQSSVQGPSFTFCCSNSKAETPNQQKGGVGLANVRKRLGLIYQDRYTLAVNDTPQIYTVELTLPLTS